jgi:replicative DNA helicase
VDLDLLQTLKSKDNFQRFKPYIKEHVLSKETHLIINSIDAYYKQFKDSKEIDWAAFESYFFVLRNSQLTKELVPNFRTIFTKLKAGTTSAAVDEVLKHYVTQDYATQIADAALKVREGRASMDDIGELVAQHDKELGRAINVDDLFVDDDVSAVLEEASAPGLDWRLEELNISCGPLRKGDFVLVGAYVETGKTTFAASEVSHMATQIKDGRPVVWVNNEERSGKVMLRIQQAALGLTLADIKADPAAAKAAYDALVGTKRIRVLSSDAGLNSVERLIPIIRDTNPALIVFDQLDKVAGFHAREENEASRLGKLYKWARELSHEYGPVIAISQTDATGEGTKYITMNQLRGSKVDKPGEADAIITIGKDSDPKLDLKRYIHIPKNKLHGGPRSNEAERHGYWEVEIKPEVARYVGTR